eukprot:363563-Chlamydomonas_euryale.AAC.2
MAIMPVYPRKDQSAGPHVKHARLDESRKIGYQALFLAFFNHSPNQEGRANTHPSRLPAMCANSSAA